MRISRSWSGKRKLFDNKTSIRYVCTNKMRYIQERKYDKVSSSSTPCLLCTIVWAYPT
jgi:hypothetical protein